MKAVRTIQRYKCDFCKKRSVKNIIELHEKRCFRNPARFCDYCENSGHVTTTENDTDYEVDCHYCSQFSKKMLVEIENRELEETKLNGGK